MSSIEKQQLKMHIEPSVIEELADKLYDNKQALIAELVANAYDADATEVYIEWSDERISIMDNGNGMTRKDVNESFLVIGKRKSKSKRISNVFKRPSLGSKGIGKLASIALANVVSITSWVSKKEIISFELNSKKMYETKGEYKPKENQVSFTPPKDKGTIIVMSELKDTTNISTKQMARLVANVYSVILKDSNFKIYLKNNDDDNRVREILINDKRKDVLDNIISFEEKMELPLKFELTDKDKKAKLSLKDITKSTTINEIIEEQKSDSRFWDPNNRVWSEKSLNHKLLSKVATIKLGSYELIEIPNEKLKIKGWIGTVFSQKSKQEIKINDKEIIVPIIYDANVNVVVNKRIGQINFKESLVNLTSRFYIDYIVGELHVDFFDDKDYKGMARSDRQGYIATDARFKYLRSIISDIIPILIKRKDVVKKMRKDGIKRESIKKTNETKENADNELRKLGANDEVILAVNEIISKDTGYKSVNNEKMVFISFKDYESDISQKVYEACSEINAHLNAKHKFDIFYTNSNDTSSYKLYHKLKEKLGADEVYSNIFSFVVLTPNYVNNWYTDIEFGMIHQSSTSLSKNYGFITSDKSIKPLPRPKEKGNEHKDYKDYDLLDWPACGTDLADIREIFKDMVTNLKIANEINKDKLEEIVKRNFEL